MNVRSNILKRRGKRWLRLCYTPTESMCMAKHGSMVILCVWHGKAWLYYVYDMGKHGYIMCMTWESMVILCV